MITVRHLSLCLLALLSSSCALAQSNFDKPPLVDLPPSTQSRHLSADAFGNTIIIFENYHWRGESTTTSTSLTSFAANGQKTWSVDAGEGSLVTASVLPGSIIIATQIGIFALGDNASASDVIDLGPRSSGPIDGASILPVFVPKSTMLRSISTATGQTQWRLELPGSVSEVLADGQGGLRVHYSRSSECSSCAPDQLERLAAIRSGSVLWDIAVAR